MSVLEFRAQGAGFRLWASRAGLWPKNESKGFRTWSLGLRVKAGKL